MHLKQDLELTSMSADCTADKNAMSELSCELETLFNNVVSTVVDYFEEAVAE
ncbi:MAG: hypothetical protein LUB59_05645 [Candidatus Gastranaerophilales bacterium]|nr:hypothetical protein [Candidatus Gastranaerophilales bacterium]